MPNGIDIITVNNIDDAIKRNVLGNFDIIVLNTSLPET